MTAFTTPPTYFQPTFDPGTAPSVRYGQQMKRRSSVLVWLVWPLLTLGIYNFVWYFKIHKEMQRLDSRQQISAAGSVLTILFGSILIVPPFVSYFNTGKRIANAQRAAGLAPTANPWIGLLLLFVLGLTTIYYQSELNKIVDRYSAPAGTTVQLAS